MKAMVLNEITKIPENQNPLELVDISIPEPASHEILVKVSTCGVCHTELDEIEGRTPPHSLPVIPGHQVVGLVEKIGSQVKNINLGDRVGIAWIYSSCGICKFCKSGMENLCPNFLATGRDVNGGYAQYMTVHSGFAYHIPEAFSDQQAAPLLCAGAIGYRSLRLSNLQDGGNLGLAGFGGSGHLVLKMVKYLYPNTKIFVFSRTKEERSFAENLGADWTGDFDHTTPEKLDCIIETTPVWKPIVEGLFNLNPGGRLVINAIRKEDLDNEYLLRLDYSSHLWMEKEIKSVANITRQDIKEFLDLAARIPILPEVQEFKLEEANHALVELKTRKIRGSKVLTI
jgi:propanol-preferring alcohol dehydrogenase